MLQTDRQTKGTNETQSSPSCGGKTWNGNKKDYRILLKNFKHEERDEKNYRHFFKTSKYMTDYDYD